MNYQRRSWCAAVSDKQRYIPEGRSCHSGGLRRERGSRGCRRHRCSWWTSCGTSGSAATAAPGARGWCRSPCRDTLQTHNTPSTSSEIQWEKNHTTTGVNKPISMPEQLVKCYYEGTLSSKAPGVDSGGYDSWERAIKRSTSKTCERNDSYHNCLHHGYGNKLSRHSVFSNVTFTLWKLEIPWWLSVPKLFIFGHISGVSWKCSWPLDAIFCRQ